MDFRIATSKIACNYKCTCIVSFNVILSVFHHSFIPSSLFSFQVSVTLLDQNDTPPKFDNNSYIRVLSEGLLPGTEVLKMSVTDADTQGGPVTITIVGGNDDNIFTVDNSGQYHKRFCHHFNTYMYMYHTDA